jgi:hypothetical protein
VIPSSILDSVMGIKISQLSYRLTDTTKTSLNGVVIENTVADTYFPSSVEVHSESVAEWRLHLKTGSCATGNLYASWDRWDVDPMSCQTVSFYAPDLYYTQVRQGGQSSMTAALENFPDRSSEASNLARQKLWQKIISTERKLQGGVMIGEIFELMRMLRRPADGLASSLLKYYDGVKKVLVSGPKTAKRANSKIRALYLEATYGWSPLISDTRDAAELLAEKHLHLSREVRFIRAKSTQESGNSYGPYQITLGFHRWHYHLKTKRQDTEKWLVAMAGTTRWPILRTVSDLGFAPEDFIPTVYNLIPYSFILDYFSNTGAVLDAWSHRSIDLEWLQKTNFSEVSSTRHAMRSDNVAYHAEIGAKLVGESFREGKCVRRRGNVNRQRVYDESLSRPTLNFEIPGVRQTINMAVLADSFRRLSSGFARLFG